MTIRQLGGNLVWSLLLDILFEKLKFDPKQKSISRSKCKLADYELKKKEESARSVLKECSGSYEKTMQEPLRETSNTTVKKMKAFCSDSDKFLCFDCFNDKHHTIQ